MKPFIVMASGLLLTATTIFGQGRTNCWTGSVGGNWHDLTWSLGVRPDINQGAVMVTNGGQKSVTINSTTVGSFPGTMVISNLTVAGTPVSTNTLFLDHTGTQTPLQIFNSCIIGKYGALTNLEGAIEVQGSNSTLSVNGTFNQSGGTVTVTNLLLSPGTFQEASVSRYFLTDGALTNDQCSIGFLWSEDGTFVQSGGTHRSHQIKLGEDSPSTPHYDFPGTYILAGGTLLADVISPAAGGKVSQTGGTNLVGSIGPEGSYALSNGCLNAGSIFLRGDTWRPAYFYQGGGLATISGLTLFTPSWAENVDSAVFEIESGKLECGNISISGPVSVLSVNGGSLSCSNISLSSSESTNPLRASCYSLQHRGGTLTNTGQIAFAGGILYADNVTEQLGSILLNTTSTDFLGTNPIAQHFQASAQNVWSPDSTLQIYGWQGSPTGGGLHQIYVGNSRYGLTSSQLKQVVFNFDPFGEGGTYTGKLLDSGELVPETRAAVTAVKNANNLFLNWPYYFDGFVWSLQSATNVTGPYYDVFPAIGSFAMSYSEPQRFFRLRNGNPWSANDIGSVGSPGSASTFNGLWTISGDGADIWGAADAFQYASQPWSGDGSITARVLACQNTDPWAKAGVMFRASLDPAAANFTTVVSPSGPQVQWRASSGGPSYNWWSGTNLAPYWVKAARKGNTFLGCVSPDGTNWTMLPTQTVPMTDPTYAGLAVTSHTTNALNTATLDNVSFSGGIAPLPWGNLDIGPVYKVGLAVYSNGTFTVKSYGYDCWSTADQFQCVYQPVTGDASLTVHIASLENSDPWAKAGVMFRNDLSAGAQYSGTMLTPGNGTILQRRYLANDGTLQMAGPNLPAPCWLGVVRRGNVFYNYASSDGTSWTLIGSADTVTMGATAYAVVFVTTHNSSSTVSETAFCDYVSVTQP